MPKIVDVEKRRADIARACWRVILREGISGVTTRRVATEAGVGAGVLFHYFVDKEAIILAAFELLVETFREQMRDSIGPSDTAFDRLRTVALTNLPLAERRADEFGVWLSMWAHTYSSEALRLRQQEYYRNGREALSNMVQDAIDDGHLRGDLDPDVAAAQLVALTDGFVVHLDIDPQNAALRDAAVRAVDDLLDSWAVHSPVAAGAV